LSVHVVHFCSVTLLSPYSQGDHEKFFELSVKLGTDQSEQCSQTMFLRLMCGERFLRTFTSWRTLFLRTFDVPYQSGKVQSEHCSSTYHMRAVPASPEFDSGQGTRDGRKLDIWHMFRFIC
jgi:hypothetical protein